jgi:hypothetical protein
VVIEINKTHDKNLVGQTKEKSMRTGNLQKIYIEEDICMMWDFYPLNPHEINI